MARRLFAGAITLCEALFCLLGAGRAGAAEVRGRVQLPLRRNWFVKQAPEGDLDLSQVHRELNTPAAPWYRARMPAQVHEILLREGAIRDPHVGKNAAACTWVGEKDWLYACRFPTPRGPSGPRVLRFEGLDTLATVYLNGKRIGTCNNMYRRYHMDVTGLLAPEGKENLLVIHFHSVVRYLRNLKVPPELRRFPKHKFVRKCHSDFGSYLGARPHSIKVGVFRDVVLDCRPSCWLDNVWVRTSLNDDFSQAEVTVRVRLGGRGADHLTYRLRDPEGTPVASGTEEVSSPQVVLHLPVGAPKLWWPWTHGTPHLYRLSVALLSSGTVVDKEDVAVGIRRIDLVREDPVTGEKRFCFEINGTPIFLRGACWAPVEGMTHVWPAERARRLLDFAQHCRMNVLRIWGEGEIPPQSFYDACDGRGILLWQDFMFGYGMHPSSDAAFLGNCRLEIEDMIVRLRNHPSVLLWVGGNENHMGWNFRYGTMPRGGRELFERVMPAACARLDPDRPFHPSSPYGGPVPNWPLEGDWHDYSTLKFCPEASVPLYASEVGRASAPSLESMRRFLSEEELWPKGFDPAVRVPGKPAWPPVWQYRSVGGSWDKVGAVHRFLDPKTPGELIRVLGSAHGEYLTERIERHRRGVPNGALPGNRRCWGTTIWRLNDAWPIVYWSVIDYYLEPKIAYWYLRRAYDPVLISFEKTPDRIYVWVVNDGPEPVEGELTVQRRRFDGRLRGALSAHVSVFPSQAKRCIDTTELGPTYLRTEFFLAKFGKREVVYLLAPERYLHLPKAKLAVKARGSSVTIRTDKFAYQVVLTVEGQTGVLFDDNYFHLPPGKERSIAIRNAGAGTRLRIHALNAPPVSCTLKEQ